MLHLTEKRCMKKIKMLAIIAVAIMTLVTKADAQKKPPPPPPKPNSQNINPHVKMDEFLKNNPTVADIYWEKKNLVVVKLKNGKAEKYNVANGDEKKSFVDKYGDVPTFLPPPPPPPPKE